MSNLDKLTSKILNDAKEKAKKIIENAEINAREKYEEDIKKYNNRKNILKENALRERELISERIKSSGSLKVRNEKLAARQIVIDKVINSLLNVLINMSEEEYINYIKNNIELTSLENKKIMVMEKYYNVVKKLFPQLKIDDKEFVSSGFILEEKGIQENYTFEVKLNFMRDELEVEISKMLFS